MPASAGPHQHSVGICQHKDLTEARFYSLFVIMFTSKESTREVEKLRGWCMGQGEKQGKQSETTLTAHPSPSSQLCEATTWKATFQWICDVIFLPRDSY